MIICGCGEGFKTQAGLNEHRRIKHDKMPMAAPLPIVVKKRGVLSPEGRVLKSASAKAQWQGEHREKQLAAIREGQRKRRERERLEKAQAKIEATAPVEVSLPPPEPPPIPVAAFPDAYGALLRQRLAEAVTALVDFEVQRALESSRVSEPEPKPPEPVAPTVASVVVPVATKPERTIPLPRGDWSATRAMRTNRIEPVERPPLPAPLPTEVETVTEPDDPENVHRNLGMRAAIAIAGRLGIRVRKNSAGEIEFAHALYPRRMRVNAARHTAPRVLLTMLREVEKSIELGRPTRVGPTR